MTTMTPSKSMTDGQIGKIKERLDAALRKADLPSEPVQQVLATKSQGDRMIAEMTAVVRRYVEAISSLIIRHVEVNRSRTPQQVLDTSGCKQYTDREVVNTMPRGEGDEAEVVFFKLDLSTRGGHISDDDLVKEYELRGLVPADPYSLAAVNETDQAFANEKPNCTHWKNASGKWCFATFNHWDDDERLVNVLRGGVSVWDGDWWFGGLRKSGLSA